MSGLEKLPVKGGTRLLRPRLVDSLSAWGSAAFVRTLRAEIKALPTGELPLTQATSQGGHIDDRNLEVTVFHVEDDRHTLLANVGIFFTEVVICCGCGDDPMPTNAYCRMQVKIDKVTAEAQFAVISD